MLFRYDSPFSSKTDDLYGAKSSSQFSRSKDSLDNYDRQSSGFVEDISTMAKDKDDDK